MKSILTALAAFAINLQLFADAGTLVNATGNYVNAYTGDTTPFDAQNSLSGELKTFYDTELLENARVELYYAQFAKKQPLPNGRGKTVEWRNGTPLQEQISSLKVLSPPVRSLVCPARPPRSTSSAPMPA